MHKNDIIRKLVQQLDEYNHNISEDDIDIIDVKGTESIRDGFKFNLRPALIMVDISRMSPSHLTKAMKRWSALASLWDTSALFFYDSLNQKQRAGIIEAIGKGTYYDISRALKIEEKGKGRTISRNYWLGYKDFSRFQTHRLNSQNRRLEKSMDTYLLEKSPYKGRFRVPKISQYETYIRIPSHSRKLPSQLHQGNARPPLNTDDCRYLWSSHSE